MSKTPEGKEIQSEMTVTPELEKAMETASTDEIRELVRAEAEKQGFARDEQGRFASPVAATPTAGTEAKAASAENKTDDEDAGFTDTFVIGGKEVEIHGADSADVLRQYKAAVGAYEIGRESTKTAEVKAEEPKGLTPDQKVALDLDYKNGRISADEYLEKTGAIDRYLESKGVKVDELKDVVEERKGKKEADAWENATNEFLASSEWPGGTTNQKLMGYKLIELGLNNTPTAASFQKAYEALKEDGILVTPTPEHIAEVKAREAAQPTTKVQPTAVAPVVKKKATGSTVFGTSQESGVRKTKPTTATTPTITDKMSPKEIMDAYKEAALAQGLNPDEILAQAGKA